MYTIVIKTQSRDSTRVECCISKSKKDLIEMLMILEDSSRVKAYKVVDSDSGIVKDLYDDFGLGQMDKFTSNNFIWD